MVGPDHATRLTDKHSNKTNMPCYGLRSSFSHLFLSNVPVVMYSTQSTSVVTWYLSQSHKIHNAGRKYSPKDLYCAFCRAKETSQYVYLSQSLAYSHHVKTIAFISHGWFSNKLRGKLIFPIALLPTANYQIALPLLFLSSCTSNVLHSIAEFKIRQHP